MNPEDIFFCLYKRFRACSPWKYDNMRAVNNLCWKSPVCLLGAYFISFSCNFQKKYRSPLFRRAPLLHVFAPQKKRACQHRWNVTHALIEWHVVERSTRLHTAKVSLENDMFSALIQVPDLYESLCPCSGITEMVDKVPGTSVTWQAITVKSLYLRSVWKQIRSGFAYCGKTHAGAHTPFCGVRFDRRVQSAFA